MTAPAYDLEYIQWDDHSSKTGGWLSDAAVDATEPVVVDSVGWVVRETERYVVLSSTMDDDPDDRGHRYLQCIVKSCIIKRKRIKL